MRILLISGLYPPMKCGIGDYTAELAAALMRNTNSTVGVVTDSTVEVASNLSGRVDLFPIIKNWDLKETRAIVRHIVNWRPDVIHMQFGSSRYSRKLLPWLLPTLLSCSGLAVIQTWHELPQDILRILRNLPNALIPGGLVVVRPEIETAMSKWYRCLIQRKKFRIIPNATSIPSVPLLESERTIIRRQLAPGAKRLIAFFGFATPGKGIEHIFEVLDPETDCLVLICDLDIKNAYQKELLDRIHSEKWKNNVKLTGYLTPEKVGRTLAAVDAVVLPYLQGGGAWSTAAHAVLAQGTFLLATSLRSHGYDPIQNAYYLPPVDYSEMRAALKLYAGRRITPQVSKAAEWEKIANAHMLLYQEILNSR